VFSTQDAHGPIRRGLIVLSCQTASVLNSVTAANQQLATLIQLLGAPTTSQICPTTTQASNGG
jgi:phospholipid/cholesterol/gamma-HCH transport system substrate-binding protein